MDDDNDDDRLISRPTTDGVRIIGAEEAAAALESGQVARRRPDDAPRFGDVPPRPAGPAPATRFPLPDDSDIEMDPAPTPSQLELPHWTEPPTGEVPRILATDADEPEASDDDLAAWSAFSAPPRWRDQQADWEEPDFEDASALADETRIGVLDDTRTDHSDLYSFEDDTEAALPLSSAPSAPPVAPAGRARPRPEPERTVHVAPAGPRDVGVAAATGIGVAVVALLMFRSGPAATMVLATGVVLLCAVELFDVLRRAGHRPATLMGLTATVSIMLASYARGETAVPLVITLAVVFTLLWYLAGVVRARPTVNVAVTLMAFLWVGFLGSFSALLLRLPERRGIAFLLGAVLATVAYDVGGFFIGSRSGRTPLAPEISPNKTWEGLLGGAAAAVVVSVVVTRAIHPWDLGSAFALGLAVAVVAPLGDLCQSMIKRDLGVKDMGTMLPGHGGMLDRFDALLFVLPATYYLVRLLDLA
ncbi:MAG TPA: phosphatidate cytidylyltransferase [Acidimicrobiales bacterium]|nr:phosphatidate cytidylyltransferase [Acidimicrobiales bacterium]